MQREYGAVGKRHRRARFNKTRFPPQASPAARTAAAPASWSASARRRNRDARLARVEMHAGERFLAAERRRRRIGDPARRDPAALARDRPKGMSRPK